LYINQIEEASLLRFKLTQASEFLHFPLNKMSGGFGMEAIEEVQKSGILANYDSKFVFLNTFQDNFSHLLGRQGF
jgi:hypothetical protein